MKSDDMAYEAVLLAKEALDAAAEDTMENLERLGEVVASIFTTDGGGRKVRVTCDRGKRSAEAESLGEAVAKLASEGWRRVLDYRVELGICGAFLVRGTSFTADEIADAVLDACIEIGGVTLWGPPGARTAGSHQFCRTEGSKIRPRVLHLLSTGQLLPETPSIEREPEDVALDAMEYTRR